MVRLVSGTGMVAVVVRTWAVGLLAGVCSACPPPPRVGSSAGPDAVSWTVTTQPPGAQVTLDGVPRGTTPLTVKVNPGSHALRLASTGYFTVENAVEVSAQGGTHNVPLVASH